tara:strand:+ start:677 stop:871 length:195 start_codon:yes stop_codon:yes gene_type:complete
MLTGKIKEEDAKDAVKAANSKKEKKKDMILHNAIRKRGIVVGPSPFPVDIERCELPIPEICRSV